MNDIIPIPNTACSLSTRTGVASVHLGCQEVPGGEQPFVGGTSAVRDNYDTGTKKAAMGVWAPKWGGTVQQEHATAVLNTHKSHRHPSGTNPGSLENNFEPILKEEEKFPFSNYCNERGVAVLDRERVIVTPFQNSARQWTTLYRN